MVLIKFSLNNLASLQKEISEYGKVFWLQEVQKAFKIDNLLANQNDLDHLKEQLKGKRLFGYSILDYQKVFPGKQNFTSDSKKPEEVLEVLLQPKPSSKTQHKVIIKPLETPKELPKT